MFVIRGKRHANGRTDVIIYTAGGEVWLHQAAGRKVPYGLQYEWGNRGPGAALLAKDILRAALCDDDTADLLAEEFLEQWICAVPADSWCYAGFEITRWVIRELANEVVRHRESPGKGGVPCPSEN